MLKEDAGRYMTIEDAELSEKKRQLIKRDKTRDWLSVNCFQFIKIFIYPGKRKIVIKLLDLG